MPRVLFRVIKAKPVNWTAFYAELAKTLDAEVKPKLLEYFQRVTKSWKNTQTFKAKKIITQTLMAMNVYPTGTNARIWRFVSQGTKGPYDIPKTPRPYNLKFVWGGYGSYKPKTTTRGGYNGPGRVVGGKIHRPKKVSHPGIKARNFEAHIARWYAPQFRRTMKNAVARAMRRAKA